MESDDSGEELLQDVVLQICDSVTKNHNKKNSTFSSKPELPQQCQLELQNAQALMAALSGISLPLPPKGISHSEGSVEIQQSFNSSNATKTAYSPVIYVSTQSLQQGIQVPSDTIVEVIASSQSNIVNDNSVLSQMCISTISDPVVITTVDSSNIDNQQNGDNAESQRLVQSYRVNQLNNFVSSDIPEPFSSNVNKHLDIPQKEVDVSLNKVHSLLVEDSAATCNYIKDDFHRLKPVGIIQMVGNAHSKENNKSETEMVTLNGNLITSLANPQTILNGTVQSNNSLGEKYTVHSINMHDYCIQNVSCLLEEPQLYTSEISNLQEIANQQGTTIKCPRCSIPIVRRNFKRHLKEKHNLLVDLPSQYQKETEPFLQRAVTCPECYMLLSRKNLKRHLRNIHKASNLAELEWKGKSTKCPECDTLVSSKNLRKHLKYVHKILHYIREDDIEKRKIPCSVCNILVCPNSLKKHLKLKHNIDYNSVISDDGSQQFYKCQKCNSSFAKKVSLRKHMRLSHNIRQMNINCREENCNFSCNEVIDLGAHLEKEHGIPQMKIEKNFASLDEFESWKVQLEKETDSRFVKHRSSWGSQNGATVTKYYCNRSGFYISKNIRKRKSRIQGSCKMSGYCTAFMYIIWDKKSGAVQVTASSSHYGHGKEYEHLSYKNGWITIRVAQEMTANEKIFDNVKDSLSEQSETLRKIVNKEIRDISLAFGMRGCERHANENLSLSIWIMEMKKLDSHSVLYAKLWNEVDERELLNEEDLIIILQTPIQAEMMRRFGQFIVSIDMSAGTTGHNCFITGISIIDENGDGFPVAWCISSKNDNQVCQIFFKVVAENVGCVKCKWLIYDGDENYYNFWVEYFGSTPQKLLCSWHVDQIWRKKLGETVEDINEEIVVYKKLQILKEEPNIEKFNVLLKCIISNLCHNSETYNFGLFLKHKFVDNVDQWAFCYRIHINSNTNIYLECLHQVLKYIRLRCKLIRRLDHVIVILLKYVRDKAYERLLKLYEGKTGRIQSIYANHVQSLKMPCSIVKREKKGTWKVIDDSLEYFVTRIGSSTCKCPLYCPDCPVCVHEFYCSCLMSLIQTSICKHIHLVHRYYKKRRAQTNFSVDHLDSDVNYCSIDLEKEDLEFLPNNEISGEPSASEAGRSKLITGIRHLCTYIQKELGEIPVESLKMLLEKFRKTLQEIQIIKQKKN